MLIPLSRVLFSFRDHKLHPKPLYALALMLFFLAVFDGIVAYTAPLILTQSGLTKTMMGFVLGSSSVAGGIFDFVLSKFFKNTHFRRLYLVMFVLCFFYPIILLQAKAIWVFAIAMGMWGLYYDLVTFGNFDFIGRVVKPQSQAASFGILDVFKGLGYLIAPIFAGLLIGEIIDWKPFALAWIFLCFSVTTYVVVAILTNKKGAELIHEMPKRRISLLKELKLWKKVGRIIFPILLFTVLLNIIDSFFWVVGPILSESLMKLHPLGGLVLTFYMLPGLLVGWFIGPLTAKYGKKRTAFFSVFLGGIVLSSFSLFHEPVLFLVAVLLFSTLSSVAWPSIKAVISNFISEAPKVEEEIEGLGDFSNNVGYVIGPILAGFLADKFGDAQAFSILGGITIFIVIIVIFITPRKINLQKHL